MKLWKQRLHKPMGDDGDDSGGGSAMEKAIDAIGVTPDAGEPAAPEQADANTEPQGADEPGNTDQAAGDHEPRDPLAKTRALLDSLSDDPAKPAPKADDKPAADGEKKPDAAAKPEDKPEADEAELLDGLKDRSKERVRAVFHENKSLKTEITEFQELVKSTGMNADEFAQSMEFGRLVSSKDPANIKVAVEMLERTRAQLYAALGQEAPGVDLLADFPELKEQVDNLDMTREAAVELAKHRRTERQQQEQQQAQRQAQQTKEQFQATVNSAAQQMDTYLQTRATEVDHPARMAALGEKFKNPSFMQEFVSAYKPEQWVPAIKMLYDTVSAAKAAPTPSTPQPLRSRPANLGNPAPNAGAPIDRLAQRMESMGL